ncbi:membrane protein [Thraustotheca clavata]|uniref:Membrane protein n=1 Tax=Thraustotheca clavata TaxID=74557 RepID=A0A1V9Z5I2_9STRA|nr:membrane protein [Thraustotheca clavata]
MTSKKDMAVKVHMAAVVPAVALGAFILASKKGTRQHVIAGRLWTAAMFTAGISSIGIRNIMADGSMSPVHALGAATLLSVGKGNERVHIPLAVHVAAVIPASIIGGLVLASKKGTRRHVLLGRLWVGSMVTASISSFGLTEIIPNGSWSPIHALSIFTLYSLTKGIQAIRKGNVKAHKHNMIGCFMGLAGAGIFAVFSPGRRLNTWLADGTNPVLIHEKSLLEQKLK